MNFINKLLYSLMFLFLFAVPQNGFGAEDFSPEGNDGNFDFEDTGSKKVDDTKAKKAKKRIIILILGTSCSGKSTIANMLLKKIPNSICLAQDDIDDDEVNAYEDAHEDETPLRLDTEQLLTLNQAKKVADSGTIVICDIVPLNGSDQQILSDIISELSFCTVYKVLIFTPFDQLMKNAEQRKDHRRMDCVAKQFALLYKKADNTTSPSKKIQYPLSSPEMRKKIFEFSPPSSPMTGRLWASFEDSFFDGKSSSSQVKTTDCITPFDKYDYVFMNKEQQKNGKPDVDVLALVIKKWLEKQ